MYISQDPIRLDGGLNLYSYVGDPNGWVDIFGLRIAKPTKTINGTNIYGTPQVTGAGHDVVTDKIATEMAKSGKYKEIYMDLSWNTANHTSTGSYESI